MDVATPPRSSVRPRRRSAPLAVDVISSAAFVALALAFGLVVLWYVGGEAAATCYAGFVVEKTLWVDTVRKRRRARPTVHAPGALRVH